MSIDIDCPVCGESENLRGLRVDDRIDITCGNGGTESNAAGCDRAEPDRPHDGADGQD